MVKRKIGFFKTDIRIALALAYFYLMGVIGHGVKFLRPYMLHLTPWVLFLSGALFLVLLSRKYSGGRDRNLFLAWAAGTFIFTFCVEAIGVATGKVFGAYVYGGGLGPKLFGVPLLIGFNWVFVVLGCLNLSNLIIKTGTFIRKAAAAFIAASAAALFDVIMEPVAIKLGYWTWAGGVIPLQNYATWFAVAFIAALAFNVIWLETKGKLALYYLLIQSGFFGLINLILWATGGFY